MSPYSDSGPSTLNNQLPKRIMTKTHQSLNSTYVMTSNHLFFITKNGYSGSYIEENYTDMYLGCNSGCQLIVSKH